ncbi:MAG: septation protein SepH [Jatrophihabitans sp.]|uniref:septation protein SepH n=1 Tax=Jatrophihabitans sp. TaxID=1932789 RepID=UPI00390F9092
MRQLRFVMVTEDGDQLLLETMDGSERFVVTVDAALRDATDTDLPRSVEHATAEDPIPAPKPIPPPVAATLAPPERHPAHAAHEPADQPQPTPAPAVAATGGITGAAPISPREIQIRVRAGESPEQVADAYGMSLERVMRFAAPVVDERLRIADEARRARARRSGGPEGSEGKLVQFGETVDARFRAYGIDAETIAWNSRRRDDGEWLVVADWLGGDGNHSAEWLFSRTGRSVTPLDDTAADLLSDRPIRPVAPPEPTRPSLVSAPALAPGIVAFPPMPDAHTGPVPQLEEVFDQEAPPEGPRQVPPLVPAASAMHFDAPPLPLGITDPPGRPGVGALRNLGVTRRDESDEERAARARVPSWDDIMLGVRRKDID